MYAAELQIQNTILTADAITISGAVLAETAFERYMFERPGSYAIYQTTPYRVSQPCELHFWFFRNTEADLRSVLQQWLTALQHRDLHTAPQLGLSLRIRVAFQHQFEIVDYLCYPQRVSYQIYGSQPKLRGVVKMAARCYLKERHNAT